MILDFDSDFGTYADVFDRRWLMLIDGEQTGSQAGRAFDVIDPGRGEVLASVPEAGAEEVDNAVRAARRAFDTGVWSGKSGYERARILWGVADAIEANAEQLAIVESLNQGMPLSYARDVAVPETARCFRYYAGWADKIVGHASPLQANGRTFHTYTQREPIGVAALIIPWNAPLLMAAWKLAPALATGCTCVLKPAEETPLTAIILASLILQAGIPDGVMNLVTGPGPTTGALLAAHSGVDKVAFTGSTEVGRSIITLAAGNLKKVSLELGGKSPVIVFGDADVDIAAAGAAAAIFSNAGQVCTAGSRLYVHESVYSDLVGKLSSIASSIPVGYCLDGRAKVGPLISAKQRDRVVGYLEGGVAAGAKVATGGTVSSTGYFMEPTVLTDTTAEMKVVREEIFGPVVAAMAFSSTDDVVAMANDSRYGLAASVWTSDVRRAHDIADRLRVGRVGINVHGLPDVTMPTGGYKQSGWGRELGPGGVDGYLETKLVFSVVR